MTRSKSRKTRSKSSQGDTDKKQVNEDTDKKQVKEIPTRSKSRDTDKKQVNGIPTRSKNGIFNYCYGVNMFYGGDTNRLNWTELLHVIKRTCVHARTHVHVHPRYIRWNVFESAYM